MSETPERKHAYAVRREMRLRRDKTAALLMAALVAPDNQALSDCMLASWAPQAARKAVFLADALLAELDRTAAREGNS